MDVFEKFQPRRVFVSKTRKDLDRRVENYILSLRSNLVVVDKVYSESVNSFFYKEYVCYVDVRMRKEG